MKKVISLLLTAMLLLSMLPATMAEGVEYIPAPYALDAERAGPKAYVCLLYTSPSPRDLSTSRMPSSA